MGISIEQLPIKFQDQIRRKIAEGCTSFRITNNKSSIGNESLGKKEVKGFDRPVNIHYHIKRNRLCDADGNFTKYTTDSLVSCKVLQDDSPEHVKEITTSQEKSKVEETIIEIYE